MTFSPLEVGIIALLATYRITAMLNNEMGPGQIFAKLRTRVGVVYDVHSNPQSTGFWSEVILCFYCLSVWVATFVTAALVVGALSHVLEGVLIVLAPFALSGGAVFMKKWAG